MTNEQFRSRKLNSVCKGRPSHDIQDLSVISEKESTQPQKIIGFVSHGVSYEHMMITQFKASPHWGGSSSKSRYKRRHSS